MHSLNFPKTRPVHGRTKILFNRSHVKGYCLILSLQLKRMPNKKCSQWYFSMYNILLK